MIHELLKKQKEHLDAFFRQVDVKEIDALLQILLDCKGTIIFSGIGKSGLIAEKIAMTFTSTGTKALYLSPMNALHGDIGIVQRDDVFILLSKSGESDELLELLPFLRNRGAQLIAVVSKRESRLANSCDQVVFLPLQKELCPFDLAPTTSAVLQMLLGDLLAVALMQHKKFSLDQYALNHPAGRIGKRITLKVKDLMLRGEHVPICRPDQKLKDSLVELSGKRCGCILVVDQDEQLQGIFTDGDLGRALQSGEAVLEKSLDQLMTSSARTTAPETLAWEALQLMESDQKKPITVMPVTDEKKRLVGLIKMHDILQSGI